MRAPSVRAEEMHVDTDRHWRLARVVPVIYDVGVEHERVAALGGRLLWGADVAPMYRGFAALGALPPGAAVLDVPCGGGIAFRGLHGTASDAPGAPRYVAADLSPVMLDRARSEAARRGCRVAFTRVSVARLPFRDAAFDLVLSYNGLHCFPDPAGAVAEMARVLRPGGTLRGTAVIRGAGRRQDAFIALLRRRGEFGTVGHLDDLRGWLTAAPLDDVRVERSGAFASFAATRRG